MYFLVLWLRVNSEPTISDINAIKINDFISWSSFLDGFPPLLMKLFEINVK